MGRTPTFDLKRDARRALERGWLREGERLVEQVPVWRLPQLRGIPKPPLTFGRIARSTGRFIVRLPLYAVIGVLALAVLGEAGGDVALRDSTSGPKRPAVVISGNGRESIAGRLVTAALRNRGIWVLTDRRLAFLTVRGRTYSKFFSSDPTPQDSPEDSNVQALLETVIEIPGGAYRYAGKVDGMRTTRITRRAKPTGVYHRVAFEDGSTIELRNRVQRTG
ncbi:hypothetical protein [Glycomyces tenuis]|uniref:hypothetical protein n=1 Tax=Glycomyces tenuis TaxID=58116 RepID=UPI00041F9E8A|nr:hypothetical protein [Glycomyces tenuis]